MKPLTERLAALVEFLSERAEQMPVATGDSKQFSDHAQTAKEALARFTRKNGAGQEEMKLDSGPSERGLKFAEWFASTLPADRQPKNGWKKEWADCFDKMIAIDKRSPEQIFAVCKWAREDHFWGTNFMSPMKLRRRDGDGTQYFDRFIANMNKASTAVSRKAQQSAGLHGIDPQSEASKKRVWTPE